MSALGAIFLGDTVVFATDTICCDPTATISKNDKKLKEVIAGFSSKSIYYPHLQTSVSVLGTSLLSQEYHKFIENDPDSRGISNFDELLSATENNFVSFIDRPEIKEFKNPLEKNLESNFLGCIFPIGVSYKDEEGNKREKPKIQAFKLMVYKTHITKTLLNPVYDKLMYCMHPPLPGEIVDNVFSKHEGSQNSINDIIIDFFKEAKVIYDNSDREEPLTGGDVNFTVMTYNDGKLNTSHFTGYRFDDFDEIVDEIKKYNKGMKVVADQQKSKEVLKSLDEKDRIKQLQIENKELREICDNLLVLGKQMYAGIKQLKENNGLQV